MALAEWDALLAAMEMLEANESAVMELAEDVGLSWEWKDQVAENVDVFRKTAESLTDLKDNPAPGAGFALAAVARQASLAAESLMELADSLEGRRRLQEREAAIRKRTCLCEEALRGLRETTPVS